MSDALFFKASFSHISRSDFSVPNKNIPRMIIFEKKNSECNVMFLEYTIAPGINKGWN